MKFNWQSMGKLAAVTAVLQVAAVQQSFASGFEKGIMWGARTAGVAGIATPYIAGAQALAFNPAGLANDKEGNDVSLNVSPTFIHFEAPTGNTNNQSSSDTIGTPASLIYSRTLTKDLGLGIGFFTTAGASAQFTGVGLGSNGLINTNIAVNELSLGAGYKINEQWKVGAAYRVAFTRANFSVLKNLPAPYNGVAQANVQVNDLKAVNLDGFRLGTQYKVAEHTTLGLDYRSEININAVGTESVNTIAAGGTTLGTPGGATAKTTLPMQVNLGVMQEYTNWRAMAEYVWTQYSRVGDVHIDAVGSSAGSSQNIQMVWRDEHQIRLAGEYLGTSWPIRFGYALTSPVTNSDYPYAAFAPAAYAHTLTLGTGQIFQVGSNPLQFDIAGEYTRSTTSTGSGQSGDASTDYRSGDYKLAIMTLHAGLTYAF